MTLVEKIAHLMEQENMNMTMLAKRTGMPYTTIQNIFHRSSTNLKVSTLITLCDYFHVTMDSMVRDDMELEYWNRQATSEDEKLGRAAAEQQIICALRKSDPVTRECIYRILQIDDVQAERAFEKLA